MLTVKQHFKNLILEGNIKEALSEMMQKTEESGQKNLNEELLLLSARFNRNESQKRQGVIDDRDYNISVNRIIYTLNEYIDQLKGGEMLQPSNNNKPQEEKSNQTKNSQLEEHFEDFELDESEKEDENIPDRFVPLPDRVLSKVLYSEKAFKEIEAYIEKGLILLVTATVIESRTLHQKMTAFPEEEGLLDVQHKNANYFLGKFGNFAVVHVECTDMGASAAGGSIITISNAINAFKPKFVLMIGIAFGLDEKTQNIGDVLVSNNIISYEIQKVGDKQVVHRGPRPAASLNLRSSFKNLRNWDYKLPNQEFAQMELCDILSGEKLIDNRQFRNQLANFFPTAKGGEMEGGGLYAACESNQMQWILVKSICDFADGKKSIGKKAKQELAIETAVDVCLQVFSKKFVFESLGMQAYE